MLIDIFKLIHFFKKGKIIDYDTPINLLEKKEGFLYNLIKENGEEFL